MLEKFLGFSFDSFVIYLILWMVFFVCEIDMPLWVILFFALIIAGIINEDFDREDSQKH
jgi:hypothetical protein